mmetsp:Transcript_5198/g.17250  ORF Transcript_5198/g.17250 Transcript_5198/m.17250 type:complete len:229 (-) Transcript_5198:1190-1876(-)
MPTSSPAPMLTCKEISATPYWEYLASENESTCSSTSNAHCAARSEARTSAARLVSPPATAAGSHLGAPLLSEGADRRGECGRDCLAGVGGRMDMERDVPGSRGEDASAGWVGLGRRAPPKPKKEASPAIGPSCCCVPSSASKWAMLGGRPRAMAGAAPPALEAAEEPAPPSDMPRPSAAGRASTSSGDRRGSMPLMAPHPPPPVEACRRILLLELVRRMEPNRPVGVP